MQRRKFIIGTGALATGTAAAMGTGAFTSVSADRDITIDVADDSDALLAFTETGEANDDYVTVGDGVVGIDVSGDNNDLSQSPSGVNKDATTFIRRLFNITNQGTQAVLVWIEDQPDDWGFFADNFDNDRPDTGLGVGSQSSNPPLGGPRDDLLYLKPGESLEDVGFFGGGDDLSDVEGSLTIQAATPEEIYFRNLGEYDDVEQYSSPEDDPDFDISDLENADWRDD